MMLGLKSRRWECHWKCGIGCGSVTIGDVEKRSGSSNYGRVRSRAAHLEADGKEGELCRAIQSTESGEVP
jgi:hypothetical protein